MARNRPDSDYYVRKRGAQGRLIRNLGRYSKLPIPKVWIESEADLMTVMSSLERRILMGTKEDAIEFAREAAANMRQHIEVFSKHTEGSGIPDLGSGTITGERLTGGGLRSGVGWFVEEDEFGWSGIAGIGVGRAKEPLSPSGKGKAPHPYAFFVDRGTNPSEGRYVPVKVDVELWDMRDPTRRIKFHQIPEGWVPKFTPGANEFQDQWWQTARKRAQEKKGVRKAIGRYFREPSQLFTTRGFSGPRRSYKPHIPEYNVTGLGFAYSQRTGKPFREEDIYYGRKRVRRTEPVLAIAPGNNRSIDSLRAEQRAHLDTIKGMTEQELDEFRIKQLESLPYEFFITWDTPFGGEMRGYGGKIMLSEGDIAFNMFSLDIRMATQLLGVDNLALQEGHPDNIGSSVTNRKGLGLRLNRSSGTLRDIGEHPGTPARNFMFNTGKHMKRWLEGKYKRQSALRKARRDAE